MVKSRWENRARRHEDVGEVVKIRRLYSEQVRDSFKKELKGGLQKYNLQRSREVEGSVEQDLSLCGGCSRREWAEYVQKFVE